MTDKALISEYTWRSLDMQRTAFPDMPHYVAPDELEVLMRPSTRKRDLNIHVISYAVIANSRDGLNDFIALCKARKASVHSKESGTSWRHNQSSASLIDSWALARKHGSAKAGGEANAKEAERRFWERFAIIKDFWHVPAKGDYASRPLLAEAGISRNTVKAYLGYTREEWQRMSEAKRLRIVKGKFLNVEN